MEKENSDSSLKSDFLAAYHSILFSKTSGNELDVERRRIAVKYMTARKFESEDAAAILLNQGLKQYESMIEKTGFLKTIHPPERKDRPERRTSLRDVQQALTFVKPLPCQRKSSYKVCGRRELVDRDVENLIKLSGDGDEPTVRKVPSVHQRIPPQGNSERLEQHRPLREQGYSRYEQHHPREPNTSRFEQHHPREPSTSRFEQHHPREQNSRFEQHHPREQNSRFERQRPSIRGNDLQSDSRARRQQRNDFERMEDEEYTGREEPPSKSGSFRTAKAELHVQQQQQKQQAKKSLGGKASVNSKFVCPFKREKEREEEKKAESSPRDGEPEDERLRGIDEKLVELIRNEIMDSGALVSWDDVAGLEHAKKIIKEIVVLPMLRPDIFTGLRRPPKGILLFGPPGTGKTLIGKCIASQSKSTFFSISASSLTSKWVGEGEKMVRALFAVARVHQPSVIFMDEIDSLLTQRSETEHESSRRIKTEFLVQLDGAATGEEDRILVIGATNRPQELDEAARRRFVKRLYVPLPEFQARRQIVENLLAAERHELDSRDIDNIASLSEHYSGADMTNLCKEASMGPIRSIPFELLENIRKEDVRCVTAEDFSQALAYVRPSVSQSDLGLYVNWDRTYGSGTASVNSPKPPN